jgi:hypothetical protein
MSTARVQDLVCGDDARRAQLRTDPDLNGIDHIEVVTEPRDENQRVLELHFVEKAPGQEDALEALLAELLAAPHRITVEGGERIRGIRAIGTERPPGRDHLRVRVTEPGDFSTYTLAVRSEAIDPAYARCDFSFKAGCPSRFDCRPRDVSEVESLEEPLVDYLAKDYASFRQALLDLIPSRIPEWTDRHEADLGMTLVELLAYVGDQLSYYQDAVAHEAFLQTARRRTSLRRHALLVDYRMHDGASARTFVHIRLQSGAHGVLPKGTPLLTRIDVPLGSDMPEHPPVLTGGRAARAPGVADAVFETAADLRLDSDLDDITIHDWGRRRCTLPRGATSADLVGDLSALLAPGDLLLLEEVRGAPEGLPQDADPDHRQVVRLTEVEATEDRLLGIELTRVRWADEDGLAFPLTVSARWGDEDFDDVAVARGNLVLADHGRTVRHEAVLDQPPGRRAARLALPERPVSRRVPASLGEPAHRLLTIDPHAAAPEVRVAAAAPGEVAPDEWTPVGDLLGSGPFDRHIVVESEEDGRATVRFASGGLGLAPPDGAQLAARYRVGTGTRGNIGAGKLVHIIPPPGAPAIDSVRNPLAAWGGAEPESAERVRRLAPVAFRLEQRRAVTAEDYAQAAELHPDVDRAVARFLWTGSWLTVFLAIDPRGREDIPPAMELSIRAWVERFMQTGYDLEVHGPVFVPLEIEADVCVGREHFRSDVEQALLEALDTRSGFFHPDRFTFGTPLRLSELYAAMQAVPGVASVVVTRFRRLARPAAGELAAGVLTAGPLEILRLHNDPNFAERGTLRLRMGGGR